MRALASPSLTCASSIACCVGLINLPPFGTPGADDNASAVAVMLELARRAIAKPPGLALRFVAFTLEEPPTHATRYQGSRVFVKRLVESGEQIAGVIILEMRMI